MEVQFIHLREGALAEAGTILDGLSARRVFFVVDESAYAASGAAKVMAPYFRGRRIVEFADFELNPKLHDVERGIVQCRSAKPDVVIALGGGTAIDLAKLIGTLAAQEDPARQIVTGRAHIEQEGKPLIAVPTTSGTGSEATHFAVVYVDGRKISLAHRQLLPDYALVDAKLTHSAPPHITASTGVDALCQAVESLWAVRATDGGGPSKHMPSRPSSRQGDQHQQDDRTACLVVRDHKRLRRAPRRGGCTSVGRAARIQRAGHRS